MRQDDVEVLVVGGGPAGLGAALGAARAGARTLLVERYGFLGGVGAYSLGMPINQMLPGGRSRSTIHEALIARLRALGDEALRVVGHALVCNVEYLKVAALDALDAAGARTLLHSQVVDALADGDRVQGIVLASKEGLRRIHATVVVDASGDADVAVFAGAETQKGRESDGFLSPITLCLLLVNVDVAAARALQEAGGLARLVERARPKYPLLPVSMALELGPHPLQHCVVINHAGTRLRGTLDATVAEEMTVAEHYSRHQALQILQALREYGGPAFERAQLAATGPQVGVRETRRLKGVYCLTEDDAKTGRRFADVVAWRSGFLDVGFVRYEPMKVHDVPYRALLPERVEGLLVAGRCISATHAAASAGKSMGNCMATGHAAGLAAALAVRRGCTPRDVPIGELQGALAADGVDLEHVAADTAQPELLR
jgi:hypothetical protein